MATHGPVWQPDNAAPAPAAVWRPPKPLATPLRPRFTALALMRPRAPWRRCARRTRTTLPIRPHQPPPSRSKPAFVTPTTPFWLTAVTRPPDGSTSQIFVLTYHTILTGPP